MFSLFRSACSGARLRADLRCWRPSDSLATGTKVFLACRPVDLRNGFDGLAAKAQQVISTNPFSGHLFIFRGKRVDYFKGLNWDGNGMWMIAKRLEKGRLVWPPIVDGSMNLTPA